MPRSHDDIVQAIFEQLEPLHQDVDVNIAKAAIREKLELTPQINSLLIPITNAKAINKAAKLFRAKFHKDKLAELLKESFPDPFKILDEQLQQLEKIEGPDGRFDTSLWLTAFVAHSLIANFSKLPPTGTEGGPLRTVASLIHEYRTGVCDHDLKRACFTMLKTRIVRG